MSARMKYILALLALLLVPSLALANGGPIDVSGTYGVGNITMVEHHDITLEEENLRVEIDGDYADVAVEYKLNNHGPDARITYGFPLDVIIDEYGGEEERPQGEDIKFRIQDESGDLKVTVRTDANGDAPYIIVSDGDMEHKIDRKWFITDLGFQAGRPKILKVTYRCKCRYTDWEFSKSFKPVFSERIFQYMLEPSKNWGNGLVARFTATVDLNKLVKTGGVVKEVKPEGYRSSNNILEWKIDNFDLAKAQDIQVTYDNSAAKMSAYISEYRMPTELMTRCAASSLLPADDNSGSNYGTDNLFDGKYDTAWVEGIKGPGIGQWIELDLDKVSLSAIGIMNGYTKNSNLYYANNRIKKLKLEIQWDNWGTQDGGRDSVEIQLEPKQFKELNLNAPAPFISWLADFGDGYNRAQQIRLTILDVYPGKKYDDTPITELFIIGQKYDDEDQEED